MIDFDQLTTDEIVKLDKKLQEYKRTEKFLTGYKVTFAIRFNPDTHKDDMLTCDGEPDPEVFGDYLADTIAAQIEDDFKLKKPEAVSGFTVEKLRDDQMEYFSF